MTDQLVIAIQTFIEHSTLELAERVAVIFDQYEKWEDVRRLPHIPSNKLNVILTDLMRAGRAAGRSPAEVSLAIRTAHAVETRNRMRDTLELVVSGPSLPPFEMRRTDETILQLIQNAQERLTIVSFVIYRLRHLTEALYDASQRGVEIRMFVESSRFNEREIAYYTELLQSTVRVFKWTNVLDKSNPLTRHGVLHAKATVADGSELFISSANLTEHAMSMNIELGVLIRGGDYPRKIEQLFDSYVTYGLFEGVTM